VSVICPAATMPFRQSLRLRRPGSVDHRDEPFSSVGPGRHQGEIP
jgi:hypothetical protein